MLVGLAAALGALTVLIPVVVKGYIDIRMLHQKLDAGFKEAKEGQAATKHLVNSHLDHIMAALERRTAERDELREQVKGEEPPSEPPSAV